MDEEVEIYDRTLQDVIDNPGWYLDNLADLSPYMVRWKDYRYKTPVSPYKFVKNDSKTSKS